MNHTFEETQQSAENILSDMENRLTKMTRTHKRYMEHGAVNAAAELHAEMEALGNEIQFEQEMMKLTFY